MLGGKKARDARIHVGSSSGGIDNRSGKPQSSWTKYEWIKEVADYFNLNNWSFYCEYYASANYDSISVEASVGANGGSVSNDRIYADVKETLRKAINATHCPYDIDISIEVYR